MKKTFILLFLLINLFARGQTVGRLPLVSATPNFFTNQDYTPWLNDNMDDLVQGTWGNNDPNKRWVDVNVKLANKSKVTKVSLFDGQGQFPSENTASVYLVNGTDSTFLGTFNGVSYMSWTDYTADSVLADAIVIRKYSNDIPLKVRAYGYEVESGGPTTVPVSTSVISFSELPTKQSTDSPFALSASSNNAELPVTFSSSNPAIVSVSNENGGWLAVIHQAGTVIITASQGASEHYSAATSVTRTLVVNQGAVNPPPPPAGSGTASRLSLISATPSAFTNQDYTPWLDDNMENMVPGTWGNGDPNNRWVDVNIKLAKKSILTKISLFDGQGSFPSDHIASIYVVNGTDSTFVGNFDGSSYMAFVDYPVNNLLADAIVIRKFSNDIPQKVRAYGLPAPEPPAGRLSLVSATPAVFTNQDYTPWLNDNLDDLVQGTWGNNDPNNRWVDVRVKLAKKSKITKVSLFDGQGSFPSDHIASIYLVNGTDSTFVGNFDGSSYMAFIDYPVDTVLAEAIVIRKFSNDIPQKVRAFGYEVEDEPTDTTGTPNLINSVITFAPLGNKLSTDAPFVLAASSNNSEVPVTFSSSDASIVSVSNENGTWKATIHKEGAVSITASQAGNEHYTAAPDVVRPLVVDKVVVADNSERLSISAIIPSEYTGQDYSPWMNDNLDSLVQGTFGANDPNNKYVNVTLWLAKRSKVTKISLYDYQGSFVPEHITSVYTLKGSDTTFVGTFDGSRYLTFVDYPVDSVVADAIIIRKFGNDLPQKVRAYGFPEPILDSAQVRVNSVISFAEIGEKTTGDAPFVLSASSNNTETPLEFESGDSTVVSVANINGIWKGTIHNDGNVTIIAKQAGNERYIPAMPVMRSFHITRTIPPPVQEQVINSPKIKLDSKRWYTLDNNISLDELSDSIASPEASVVRGGKQRPVFESYYPLREGEVMEIDALKMFDGLGKELDTAKFARFYVINDKWERIPIATFSGSEYMTWIGPNPSDPRNYYLDSVVHNVRYLLIRGSGMFPTELELHGNYTAGVAPTTAVKKEVKLRDMFMVNGFEWDFEDLDIEINPNKLKAAKSFTGFRHYMEWNKLEGNEGLYTFNPTRSGSWNFDSIYEKCKEEGIEVLGCIKGIPDWMKDTYPADIPGAQDTENVPVKFGKDLTDPDSYLEQARVAFQYAARYGSNKNVDRSLMKVNGTPRWNFDPINVVKVGMNVVKYMECDNERDKTWKLYGYQTGREYAANLSAYYDGHKNTMGPGVGVKNADPSMKVVMCGIASVETDYVRGMVDWCKEFRGYNPDGSVNLCWDVVNYHAYANDGKSSQTGTYTRGVAPEVGGLAEVADDFIQMSHEICGDREVWVTETGYDLSPGSPLRAIPVGDKSAERVQADWILRTSLLYARQGISKVYFYLMYDQSTMDNFTQFATSGLLRNSDLGRKIAADFIYQTNQLFGGYTYKESLSADPVVDRYQFNGKSMYTLYVPDEKDRKANYTLNLGGMDSAYVYTPLPASDTMQLVKIKLVNGQLPLQVTETPIFVVGIPAPRAQNSYAWTGAVSTEPGTIGNWLNTSSGATNELPDENSVLTVPAGLAKYPVMSTDWPAKQLTIAQGASWDLNGYNLILSGNLTNQGTINDQDNQTSSITFSGTDTTQVYTGTEGASAETGRIILGNSHGLSLNGGVLNVFDYVKVERGSIASDGVINLKATENGFASILALPQGSAINGDVGVEVYFTGGSSAYRGTRSISSPINDLAVSGQKTYQQLKNYVIITGPGGAANGFDPGGSAAPYAVSLTKYYEPNTNAQGNFTNVASIYETLQPGLGAFIFYRGDRSGYTAQTAPTSIKVNAPFTNPESVVVKYKGPINQGTITHTLTFNYHGGEESVNGMHLVGNPYPCVIDWKLIAKSHLNDQVRIIKPGGGIAVYSDGVVSNAGQIDVRFIQPGQGFYIQANHRDSSWISFTENCKVGGKAFVGRIMNAQSGERLSLTGVNEGSAATAAYAPKLIRLSLGNGITSEETVVAFKEGRDLSYKASDGDAGYVTMNSLQMSTLTSDGQNMAINFMPQQDRVKQIKLNVNAQESGEMELLFTELPDGRFKYVLKDNYLRTNREIKLNESYSFSIDKNNPATFGSGRFVIAIAEGTETADKTLSATEATASVRIYPNPAENVVKVSLGTETAVVISVYNLEGRLLKEKRSSSETTSVDISGLNSGAYLIKIKDAKSGKEISTQKLIKK